MSESVQHDDQCLLFHDIKSFRYDEHCPALHAEGLNTLKFAYKMSEDIIKFIVVVQNRCVRCGCCSLTDFNNGSGM
jgi:hypothetical protein